MIFDSLFGQLLIHWNQRESIDLLDDSVILVLFSLTTSAVRMVVIRVSRHLNMPFLLLRLTFHFVIFQNKNNKNIFLKNKDIDFRQNKLKNKNPHIY